MGRCQPCQVRASGWSSPTSPVVRWPSSAILPCVPAAPTISARGVSHGTETGEETGASVRAGGRRRSPAWPWGACPTTQPPPGPGRDRPCQDGNGHLAGWAQRGPGRWFFRPPDGQDVGRAALFQCLPRPVTPRDVIGDPQRGHPVIQRPCNQGARQWRRGAEADRGGAARLLTAGRGGAPRRGPGRSACGPADWQSRGRPPPGRWRSGPASRRTGGPPRPRGGLVWENGARRRRGRRWGHPTRPPPRGAGRPGQRRPPRRSGRAPAGGRGGGRSPRPRPAVSAMTAPEVGRRVAMGPRRAASGDEGRSPAWASSRSHPQSPRAIHLTARAWQTTQA